MKRSEPLVWKLKATMCNSVGTAIYKNLITKEWKAESYGQATLSSMSLKTVVRCAAQTKEK